MRTSALIIMRTIFTASVQPAGASAKLGAAMLSLGASAVILRALAGNEARVRRQCLEM